MKRERWRERELPYGSNDVIRCSLFFQQLGAIDLFPQFLQMFLVYHFNFNQTSCRSYVNTLNERKRDSLATSLSLSLLCYSLLFLPSSSSLLAAVLLLRCAQRKLSTGPSIRSPTHITTRARSLTHLIST